MSSTKISKTYIKYVIQDVSKSFLNINSMSMFFIRHGYRDKFNNLIVRCKQNITRHSNE